MLVSAAAGSGKTAVLAERCCRLVCGADSNCGIESLLVVTFTEAAAREMKSRIAEAIGRTVRKRQADGAVRHHHASRKRAHMKPTIARSFAGTVLTMFLGHTAAALLEIDQQEFVADIRMAGPQLIAHANQRLVHSQSRLHAHHQQIDSIRRA